MNKNIDILKKYAEDNNIFLASDVYEKLCIYGDLLREWNEKINLTAITEPKEIVIKHFADSLSILKYMPKTSGKKIIDIGSGAGFPGMVLKIARPDLSVTLADGHAKRFVFLNVLEKELGTQFKTENVHARAEILGQDPDFRESFDFVTARAVARLNVLCEYCFPLVKNNGIFISMKGPDAENELKEASLAISLLGGSAEPLFFETLPNNEKRINIVIKKISQTPPKYPRTSAKIARQPL